VSSGQCVCTWCVRACALCMSSCALWSCIWVRACRVRTCVQRVSVYVVCVCMGVLVLPRLELFSNGSSDHFQ